MEIYMNIKKIIKHICKKTILLICSIMLIMIIGSGFKTVKVIADDKIMTINIADKNGICQAEDGTWNYYRNGKIDSDYTGLAENEAGWWKITNGAVDFTYNGMAENMYGWWKITNGAVDFTYNGLAENMYGWWKITNGAVDFTYNGLAENMYGWWKITNGAVDFDYTGNVSDETRIWKVVNGHVESEVEQSFAAQLPAAEEYSQLVVVESEGVHATVTMHEEQDGVWTEILRTDGFVGSMGVGQASAYTSVTPQGTFPLYFAFGINPDPGTIIPYLQVDEYDYWVGDSWSDVYNQYVRTDSPYTEWDDAEHIIDYPDAYGYCLFIGYNMEGTPEAGSCYFLHCSNGRPTAGCVSVSEEDMAFILTHIGDSCGIVIE